jgi:sulfonate transport system substrate-binding protein
VSNNVRFRSWVLLLATVACGRAPNSQTLPLSAPLPSSFSPETTLSLGDPVVQKQLAESGQLDALPFTASFQNISGGPHTLEAFRAGVLDGGAVGDTPPIHATFTGLSIKIIAVLEREKPYMQLAISPGARVQSIAELRGKRIAYAPGQAQGALILRVLAKAGLDKRDVTLVELTSSEFKDALGSRQVDVAPLSGTNLLRYLNQYRAEGGTAIAHDVRDTVSFFYVRTETLEDPDKAAALREYVKFRTRAQLWAQTHPDEWRAAYFEKDQGLTAEEGRYLVESAGVNRYPGDWSNVIALTQETVDALARAGGVEAFDAETIFDRRFEAVGQRAALAFAETLPRTETATR